jgi:hypothetical protein
VKGKTASALPARLGEEGRNDLFDLLALALPAGDLGLVMLGDTGYQGKRLLAIPAFILVGGHLSPPFSSLIGFPIRTTRAISEGIARLLF